MSYEYSDSYDWEELIDTLNNKISKIADLEAKLAESEEKCDEFKQAISKCTGELPPNVAFDIANDDIRYQIVCNLVDRNQEHRKTIRELKQQLAEKEHTINTLIEDHKASQEWYKMQLAEVKNSCDYYMNRANTLLQDKISFALEQLEKVKEYYTTPIYDIENPHTDVRVLLQRIDDQIKQLKEME